MNRIVPVLMAAFSATLLIAAPAKTAKPAEATVPGAKMELPQAKANVEFLAIGKPSMLKIRGVAKPKDDKPTLDGQLKLAGGKVAAEAKLPLDTLETGIALRDRHMKEKYLETAKFPQAEFTMTELTLPEALKAGEGTAKEVPFKGKLKIHGVEKEVAGTVDITLEKAKGAFDFQFKTKITDYAISLPSFMGVTVAEEVQVTVGLEGPLS